ncbi:MAG TPA: nickel pincer cofactor biosynthesis protein LarB [Candidatus Polarisedimenticolia bacterium]|nr:nickel pincer cofactor biosynthesis protein LarB [Candidatus Polarisedimenticolia bacterium]
MNLKHLRQMLERVRRGTLSADKAMRRLKTLPYEDLGFAKVDNHRALRRGFPEVIYGEGKSVPQIISIMGRVASKRQPVLVTRITPEIYRKVRVRFAKAKYHREARAITLAPAGGIHAPGRRPQDRPGILVVAAGTSDLRVAEEAAVTAEVMGNRVERVYDVGIAGLHRLLDHMDKLLKSRVIIAVAGMEGALPSIVASLVDVPVIGVPTSIGYGTGIKGVAALMGMLNSCASGLLVVNIDNGFGAGYAAAVINNSK